VGGKSFSVHAEGERMILTREGQTREEVDLAPAGAAIAPTAPAATSAPSMPAPLCADGSPPPSVAEDSMGVEAPPGYSALDDALSALGGLARLDEPVVPPPSDTSLPGSQPAGGAS
jgi:hypothetical protein